MPLASSHSTQRQNYRRVFAAALDDQCLSFIPILSVALRSLMSDSVLRHLGSRSTSRTGSKAARSAIDVSEMRLGFDAMFDPV
jgi:hypothetical protein